VTKRDNFEDVPVAEPEADPIEAPSGAAFYRTRRLFMVLVMMLSLGVARLGAGLLPRRHPYRTLIEHGITTQRTVLWPRGPWTRGRRAIHGATNAVAVAVAAVLCFVVYLQFSD
jgi:hypothetical protein